MHSSENTPQDPATRVTRSLRKRINSVDADLTTTPKNTPLRSLNKITEKDTKPMTNSPALRTMRSLIADTITPALNSPARRITRRISLSEGIDNAPQPSPIRRSRRLSVNSEELATPSKSTNVRATRGNVALVEQSVPEEEEVDKNSPDRRVTRSSSKSPQVEMMNEKRSTRTASKSPSSFENAADKRKFSNSPIESVLEKRVTRSLSKSPNITQMTSRSDSPKTSSNSVANNSSNKINMHESGNESPIPFKSPQTIVRRTSNVSFNKNSANSPSQSPKSEDSEGPNENVKALSPFKKRIMEKEIEPIMEATNDHLNTSTDVESRTDSIQSKEKSPKKTGEESTDLILLEENQSKATLEATDDHLNNSKDESITDPIENEVKSPNKTGEESEKQNSADPVVPEETQSKVSSEATNDNLDSSTDSKNITDPAEKEVKSEKTDEESDEQNSVVSEETQSKAAYAEIECVKSPTNKSENNANQLQFAKSWSQPVVKKLTDVVTFIDGFTTKEAERKEINAQKEANVSVKKSKNQYRARESDDESYYEDSEADDAANEFIDSEAMDASGDSMNSSERAYIEENEIPAKGESLGSDDTDEQLDQDEESDDMTSFIVSDEEEEKLSDVDSLIGEENVKKKYRKIITRPVIDSSSGNDEPSNEAVLCVKSRASGNDELCSENTDRQGKATLESENKLNESEVISLNSTTNSIIFEQRDQIEDELLSSDKKKSDENISNKNNQSLNSSRHKIQLAESTNDSADDDNDVSSAVNLEDETQAELFESISSIGDTSLNKTKHKSLQRKSFDKGVVGNKEHRSGSTRTSLNESMKAMVRKMLTQKATINKTSDESDEDSDDRNNELLETFKRTSLKRRSSLKKASDNKRKSESEKNVSLHQDIRKAQDEVLSDESTDAQETSIKKKEKSIIEELNNSQVNISINDSNVKDKSMGSSVTNAQKKLNKSQENKNLKKNNNPCNVSDDDQSDNENNSNNDTQNKLKQSFKKLNDSNSTKSLQNVKLDKVLNTSCNRREKSKLKESNNSKTNKSLQKDGSQELESTDEFSNNSSSYETYTESDTEEAKKIPEVSDDEQSDDNDQPNQTEQNKIRKSMNDSKQSISKRTSQCDQQSHDVAEELNHSKIIYSTESDQSNDEDDDKSKSYKKNKSRDLNLNSNKSKSLQTEDDEELSNDESDSNDMVSEDAESATEISSEHTQSETSSLDGEPSDKEDKDVTSETENIVENTHKRRSVQKIEESSDSQDDIEDEIDETKRSSKNRRSISKKSTECEKKTNRNKSIREGLNTSNGNKSLQKDTHKPTERKRSMNNTLHLSMMFNKNSTSEESDEDEQLQDSSANSCATFNKSNSSNENDEDEDETLHFSMLLDKQLNKSKVLPRSPLVSCAQKKNVGNTPDTKKSSSTTAGASDSNKKSKATVPKNVDETQHTSTPKVVAQKSVTEMTESNFHSILDRVDLFINAASEAKRKLKLQHKAEQPKKIKRKNIQNKDDAEDESVEKVPVRNKKQKSKEIKKSLPHVAKILEKEFKATQKIIAKKQSQPEILRQKVQDNESRTKPSRKRSKSESKATQGIAQHFELIDENISAYEAHLKNKSTKSKKNKLELGDVASNSKKKLKTVESFDDRKTQIAKSTTSKKDCLTSVGFFQVSDVDHCSAVLSKQKSKNKKKSASNEYLSNDFKKKKLNILNDIPFGPFVEEPVTPESKKIINGFKESNLTPKPIGFKVRSILSAGQKEIPQVEKTKRKTKKLQIEDRKLKRVWTSVGFFDVADIDEKITKKQYRPQSHGASTDFVVKPLDVQKYENFSCDSISSSALNFKKKALYNDKIRRETSTELLQRNTKKLAFKKH